MRINSSGNVGIGTTAPDGILQVRQTSDTTANILANGAYGIIIEGNDAGTSGESVGLHLAAKTVGTNPIRGVSILGELQSTSNDHDLIIATSNSGAAPTEKMRVTADGNVGIGTTSPSEKLDITGGYLKFNGGDYGLKGSASLTYNPVSDHYFQSSGSTKVVFKASGNVGIGTASPSYPFSLENPTTGLISRIYNTNSNGQGLLIRAGATSSATRAFQVASSNDTKIMTVNSNGNVGIGTTAPNMKFNVGATGGSSTSWSDKSGITNSTTDRSIFMSMYNGNAVLAGHNAALTAWHDLYINTVDGTTGMVVEGNGNVGIGTTSPSANLDVVGSSKFRGTVNHSWFNYSTGEDTYIRGGKSTSKVYINDSNAADVVIASGGGDVGIGITSPSYKLQVNGGVQAGGKVTYEKSASALTTTGYAVAGLTAGYNGASAGFTFTCFGPAGDYQRIVYSCHNASGVWNTQKVIDEGTNGLDVTASANGSTITFTFKSRSGSLGYTPRVSVEAVGHSINNTYA
jgi:hypothetical protein